MLFRSTYGVHHLTGLPEYRNGGLLLDLGVLEAVDQRQSTEVHSIASEFIVEWRALTVAILDFVANDVRKVWNQTEHELPLSKVLQAGTWSAGRQIASELRAQGEPPLKIELGGAFF